MAENSGGILAYLQANGGVMHPLSLELCHTVFRLANRQQLETIGLVLVPEITPELRAQLSFCGLGKVYACTDSSFGTFLAEQHCAILEKLTKKCKPEVVLFSATPEGRSLAPMAAVPFGTGVTADCTHLEMQPDGSLLQVRPAFGGDVMAEICTPKARPQMATVRYSVPLVGQTTTMTDIIEIPFEAALPTGKNWPVMQVTGNSAAAQWDSANIIFALGGAAASKQDVDFMRQLCSSSGIRLMGSRCLVERGWISREEQIGLSGMQVKSKLLVTFGISGSVQFMAGVQQVGKLCAVNIDADAPIMKYADLPLVADWRQVADEMERCLNNECSSDV